MSILQTKNLSKRFDGVKAAEGLFVEEIIERENNANLTKVVYF